MRNITSLKERGYMTEKVGFIKNPLTIIAIFASITETSGSIILPFILPNNQFYFMWFLILFPTFLVVIFFITLNFNHKVLYSPSDYKDEANFVKTIKYNLKTQTNQIINLPIKNISEGETLKFHNTEFEQDKKIEIIGESKLLNETFDITVMKFPNVNKLISSLDKKGYLAEIYKEPSNTSREISLESNKSIWLGHLINYKEAIEVIKISKAIYPHLEYIHLSDDIDFMPPESVYHQIFIGGATQTATQIYNLKKLTDDDFKNLYKVRSNKELHSFIRKFYN